MEPQFNFLLFCQIVAQFGDCKMCDFEKPQLRFE